jgi:hypothetical protein
MPLYFGAAFIGRVPPPCSILGMLVYSITDFSSLFAKQFCSRRDAREGLKANETLVKRNLFFYSALLG